MLKSAPWPGRLFTLIDRDRTEGVLYVDNRSPRPFTDRDEQILLKLADHAAVAIENALLFREAEQERRRAESLAELGRLISKSLDPREVAQRVVHSIQGLLARLYAELKAASKAQ